MNASPIQATAAAASVALLGLAAGAGLYEALVTRGGAPGISLDYMPRIRALEETGDVSGALRELRVATAVDAGNPGVALALEQLATQTGSLDDRIFALRTLLRANPFDSEARLRLSRAFLEQAQTVSEPRAQRLRARAVWQTELALRTGPASARAHLALAQALLAAGQDERARSELAEARRLDASLAPASREAASR